MTEKMPYWYYEKEELQHTPSIQDGIDYMTESRYRKEGAKFIFDVGTNLGLGYNTMATGVMYFHRFYMFHSFKEFPRYVTASACIFLAGKVEETPKMFEDIIKTARTLLDKKELRKFGRNPRTEMMTIERILLHTIKFDLLVDHPNNYVPKYAKCLRGSKKRIGNIVQSAWNFARDSLYTTLALQWEPEIIAIAFMYLAGKLGKFTLVDGKGRLRWWDAYVEDVSVDLLEGICHQLLDSYDQPTTGNEKSPVADKSSDSPNNSGENGEVIPSIEAVPDTPTVDDVSRCNHIPTSSEGRPKPPRSPEVPTEIRGHPSVLPSNHSTSRFFSATSTPASSSPRASCKVQSET
ncbi:cyclin-K isoform X2 [Diachasma alloeum]|uniref:cyclin-K isoform X2 n=1 Tax=Diachasma alloeum TaxID=454923 RepID=UPI000738196E|nr:cyclin-K isoform X2 [Diachasma alloeum]